MTLDLTNPDVQVVQRGRLGQNAVLAAGWKHTESIETTISADIAALDGFNGVEGLTFVDRRGRKSKHDRVVMINDASEWRSSRWSRLEADSSAPAWAFHWTMSTRNNVIIVTHAVSASLWTQDGPGPNEPIHPMTWKDWSDFTYTDFFPSKRMGVRYMPPKAIFIPALRGPSDDIEIIKLCLQGRDLGPREGAITFPIGSFYHELILGTKIGVQVAQFLYQHKAKLDICTVVAIHVWDAGDGTTMSVLFSIQKYDHQAKLAEKENRDAHELWEAVCATEWPWNLKPKWVSVNDAGVTAASSRSHV